MLDGVLPRGVTSRWLLALILAAIILAVPSVDLIVFGFHDHLADADDGGRDVGSMQGLHHSSHHCDLGMNPGHIAPVDAQLMLCLTPEDRGPILTHQIASRPFIPFTPPRA